MATGKVHEVAFLGVTAPRPMEVDALSVGEVGFLSAAIKDVIPSADFDKISPEKLRDYLGLTPT